MRRPIATALFALLMVAAAAASPPPGGEDPFARYLFPPERVMGHAQEIGLEDSQRSAIKAEVQRAQPRFLDLQFDMQSEGEKLGRLLQEKRVDEARVLAQVDRILAIEKEIKKLQLSLLVRIKNVLTPAQQAKLDELGRPPLPANEPRPPGSR